MLDDLKAAVRAAVREFKRRRWVRRFMQNLPDPFKGTP